MGKRLVEELGLSESVDTLGRWMSHYVAELMVESQQAKNSDSKRHAQDKCFEVILRLWDHRASLPANARPLGNLMSFLDAIQCLLGRDGREERWVRFATDLVEQSHDPWCEFIKESYSADRRLAIISALTAVAEGSIGKERRWIDETPYLLSEDERKVIDLLDSWVNEKRDWVSSKERFSVGALAEEERTEFILTELEQLVSAQHSAVTRLRRRLKARKAPVRHQHPRTRPKSTEPRSKKGRRRNGA